MRAVGLRWLVAGAALCSVIAVVLPSRSADAADGVELSGEEPLQLTPGKTASFEAVNNGSAPVLVQFEASVSADGATISLGVEPESVSLRAGEPVSVVVTAPTSLNATGTYRGAVAGRTPNGTPTLPITLAPVATPKVSVTKRTVYVYSWAPFGPVGEHEPFEFSGADLDIEGSCDSAPAAFAAAGGSSDLTVTPSCDDDQVHLSISGYEAGRYHDFVGTLKSGGADTEVTVRYSTFIAWPVVVLVLGFLAAVWSYVWVNGRRSLRVTRVRLLELAILGRSADRTFHDRSAGKTWQSYSASVAFEGDVADFVQRVDDLGRQAGAAGLLSSGSSDALKALEREAAPLEAFVTSWRDANEDLFQPLATQRLETRNSSTWLVAPHAAAWIDGVLDPSQDNRRMSRDAFADLVEECKLVPTVLAILSDFLRSRRAFENATGGLPPEALNETPYDKANQRKIDIEKELQLDTRSKPSQVVELAEKIDDFRSAVHVLPSRPGVETAAVGEAMRADSEPPEADEEGRLKKILEEVRHSDDSTVKSLRRESILAVDKRILALIAAIAVWSGLQAQYFGKPWGTPTDYGSAFVWAFTATVVLTPIFTLLTQQNPFTFRFKADE